MRRPTDPKGSQAKLEHVLYIHPDLVQLLALQNVELHEHVQSQKLACGTEFTSAALSAARPKYSMLQGFGEGMLLPSSLKCGCLHLPSDGWKGVCPGLEMADPEGKWMQGWPMAATRGKLSEALASRVCDRSFSAGSRACLSKPGSSTLQSQQSMVM